MSSDEEACYLVSVIQFLPDVYTGEFVNVAVVGGLDGTSDWDFRQVDGMGRARSLNPTPAADSALSAVLREIERVVLDTQEAGENLFDASEPASREWLEQLPVFYEHTVRVEPPLPVIATSATEAVNVIFDSRVREHHGTRKRYTPIQTVQKHINQALRAAGLFSERDYYFRRATLQVGKRIQPISFAVMNGRPLQIAEAFTFDTGDYMRARERVHAWAFQISRLREEGAGVIAIDGREEVEIVEPGALPVWAVYAPAADDAGRSAQADGLESFEKVQARTTDLHSLDEFREQASRLFRER